MSDPERKRETGEQTDIDATITIAMNEWKQIALAMQGFAKAVKISRPDGLTPEQFKKIFTSIEEKYPESYLSQLFASEMLMNRENNSKEDRERNVNKIIEVFSQFRLGDDGPRDQAIFRASRIIRSSDNMYWKMFDSFTEEEAAHFLGQMEIMAQDQDEIRARRALDNLFELRDSEQRRTDHHKDIIRNFKAK